MHRLYQYTKGMTEHLAKSFVDLPYVALAQQRVAKLCLYRGISCLDIMCKASKYEECPHQHGSYNTCSGDYRGGAHTRATRARNRRAVDSTLGLVAVLSGLRRLQAHLS